MKNPFPGPRPIGQSEPIFGRNREITELRHLLISERLVLLHSPSGAGKTSLINAGIIPEFEANFAVCPPTRVIFEMPGVYDKSVICSAQIGGSPLPGQSLADVPLHDFIASLPKDKNKFLVLDHFESTVRAALANPGWHTGFFRQLGQLLNDPSIWALISLREDFVAPILPLLEYIPTRLRARYRLGFLSRDHAEKAMRETALTSGTRQFADGAAARLAKTLSRVNIQNPDGGFTLSEGDSVEPLQLQVVCRRLWDAMPDDDLSIDPIDIKNFGDVVTALGAYYEQSIDALTPNDSFAQRSIREWFDQHLITPGAIRGQVLRGHNHTEGLDNAIIEKLLETHLVRAELRGTFTWYELAHDSLVAPVLATNKRWYEANLSPFQRAAALWLANDEGAAFLLTGEALAEAERWKQANGPRVTTHEHEFLQKSRDKQAALDREARYLADLEAAYAEVRAQLSRLTLSKARESQSNHEPRTALAFAARAASLDPASVPARLALTTLIRSTNFRRHLWSAPAAVFEDQPQFAAFSADGSRLATKQKRAVFVWDARSGAPISPEEGLPLGIAFPQPRPALNPDGSLLLAGTGPRSARLWDVAQATPIGPDISATGEHILAMAFSSEGRPITVTESSLQLWFPDSPPTRFPGTPPLISADFSADGSRLLTATDDTWQLWDLQSPDLLSRPLLEFPYLPKSYLYLTPNGQHLLSWKGTELTCRNLADPAHPPVSVALEEPIQTARLNLSRSLLVVRTASFITLHSASSGSPFGSPIAVRDWTGSLSPDGLHQLSVHYSGSLEFSRVSPAPPSFSLSAPYPFAGSARIVWHSSGTGFAAIIDNSIQLWDATLLQPFGEPFLHPEPVTTAIISADGESLLSITANTTIHHWTLASREVRTQTIPGQRLHSLAEREPGHISVLTVSDDDLPTLATYDVPSLAPLGNAIPLSGVFDSGTLLPGATKAHLSMNGASTQWLCDLAAGDLTLLAPQLNASESWYSAAIITPDAQHFYASPDGGEGQIYAGNKDNRIGKPIPAGTACFAPNAPILLIANSEQGTYQLYDANTGEPVLNPIPLPAGFLPRAFTPDGASLLLASGDTLQIEPLLLDSGSQPQQKILVELAELMSATTINQRGAPDSIGAMQPRSQKLHDLLKANEATTPGALRHLAESLFPELEQ
jgi:WD40 repeat protein